MAVSSANRRDVCMGGIEDSLPEGWGFASIAEVVGYRKGKKPRQLSESPWSGSVPYIDIEAFESGNIRRYADTHSSTLVQKGDALVVWDGARSGLVGKAPTDGALGSTLMQLQPFLVLPDYLVCFLRYCYDEINSSPRGSGIPHVDPDIFWKLELPLPPLTEQKRIVAKVEELLGRANAARERLDRIPKIMKRFRQSVLAAACSGKLTEDWRERHPDVEPGSALLARIKEARLANAESAKEKRQIDEAFRAEEMDMNNNETGLETILESWVTCLVGAIGAVINGSTPSRKQPEFWNGHIPWVSSGEVRNNIIVATRERITKAGYESCSVRLMPRGTVLLAMIGEGKTRGQSAILGIEATINQNIAAILIPHGLVNSEFLWRWFQHQYEATRERGSGSGPQALNCQRVRELPVVLPPLAEQQEIIYRVEALFNLAEAIEKRVALAKSRADKLTQSILAKAFRGELVLTEAELARREGRDYEPALVLLERIKAERGREKAKARKR